MLGKKSNHSNLDIGDSDSNAQKKGGSKNGGVERHERKKAQKHLSKTEIRRREKGRNGTPTSCLAERGCRKEKRPVEKNPAPTTKELT